MHLVTSGYKRVVAGFLEYALRAPSLVGDYRDAGGTGLGLAIARQLAAALSGTLTLANHPDGGLQARLALRDLAQA